MNSTRISTDYAQVFAAADCYVYRADSRDMLRVFAETGAVLYQLVFADPPFGIGVDYDGNFDDNMTEFEYQQFTREWLLTIPELLLDGGRLYVHVPDSCVHAVLNAAEEAGLTRIEWIVQHYRFGQCQAGRYINSKCHGLVFTNNPEKVIWRPEDVLVDSDRSSKYNDDRSADRNTRRNYKYSTPPGKRVPLDVWGIPSDGPNWGRIQGNNKERRTLHENQLPEVYLQRIVRGYTNPGDWILDPFGGSGTTAVVARALNRNVVTIEQSERYANSIVERLAIGAIR